MSDMDLEPINQQELNRLLICLVITLGLVLFGQSSFSGIYVYLKDLISFNNPDYPYSNPPIFFSVGEALSAIAILFAVYQFKKEKWGLSFKIRKNIIPAFLTFIALGIISSIISTFFVYKLPLNIFQLSIFWQTLSAAFVTLSIIFLLIRASNKKLFNRKNARRFYEVLSWEISRPTDERLTVVLEVLLENFHTICKVALSENKDVEYRRSARWVLDVILSDALIVKLLTTKRLDGLTYIFENLKKYNINHTHSPKGVPRIMKGLLFDHDSFLYTQMDDNGLALSANIYQTIFESPIILTNFDLFGYPTIDYLSRRGSNLESITVFIECLSRSIETYLKTGEVPVNRISRGLSHLAELFNEICEQIRSEQDLGVKNINYIESKQWTLHAISKFLGHDYLFIGDGAELNQRVVGIEKTAIKTDINSYFAINEAIAATIYECFVHLSKIEKGTDNYHTVLELLHGMISEPDLRVGYAEPFEKRIWKQVGRNILGRHYPMVTKSFLNYVGFCLASDDREGWSGIQAERMRRALYIDLKPQLDRNELMVDKSLMKEQILPDSVKYEGGKFYCIMGFGRGPTVEILPPPEGSISAFSDIDWANRRDD